jgi:hypothetical protein
MAKETPVPNTPLEILIPDGVVLSEPPKFAGKFISYLVAASSDSVRIEIELEMRRIYSTEIELKNFIELVAGAGQVETLVSHCKAVMYGATESGSLGNMACIQQGKLYSFSVFEKSSLPRLRWEFRRHVKEIVAQTEQV